MAGIDRRSFLARGSMVAAAAGVVAAVPGIGSGLVAGEADAAAIGAATDGDARALVEPLVVHARDLATGEISVFSGTREVVVHDPSLASRLFHAAG
jgi:hypothetical protein